MSRAKQHNAEYQRLKMVATPPLADKEAIQEVYDFATECRASGFDVEVDHIVPLRSDHVCGLHVAANLRVCMKSSNRSKGNRFDLNLVMEQHHPSHFGYTTDRTNCTMDVIEKLTQVLDLNVHYAQEDDKKSSANRNALGYSHRMDLKQRRKQERTHQIRELVEYHGAANVERYLEVHRTTIMRWCDGKIDTPIAAIIALRALKGVFPFMEANKTWEGWRFGRDGKLYDPSNRWYTEGEIRATQFSQPLIDSQRQLIQDLRAKLDKTQAQLDKFDTAANDRMAG